MKIVIVGNSVALRVRPPQSYPGSGNYSYLLQKKIGTNGTVENLSIGATTVSNWLEEVDTVINKFADVYIINVGVVDATTREVPLWFYRLANKKSEKFGSRILKGLYRGAIAKNRKILAKIRGNRSWISKKRFTKEFDQLLQLIIKDTNAKIITLSINPANDRIEGQLPGSKRNQLEFNQIIKTLTQKHQQTFIDLSDINAATHYPDGVHYNGKGHQEVAERLFNAISKAFE